MRETSESFRSCPRLPSIKHARMFVPFRVARRDNVRTSNGEIARVVRGEVGRIRKYLSRFEALRRERNGRQEVLSGTWNQKFGDETAVLEGLRFFVEGVNDVIEYPQ